MRIALLPTIDTLSLLTLITVISMRVHTEPASETPPPLRLSPRAQEEIRRVEARIDNTEAAALADLAAAPDRARRIALLRKLFLFGKNLSANKNEACAFCHMPEAGFCAPASALNMTTVSYPGSVRSRFSNRMPQPHAYSSRCAL